MIRPTITMDSPPTSRHHRDRRCSTTLPAIDSGRRARMCSRGSTFDDRVALVMCAGAGDSSPCRSPTSPTRPRGCWSSWPRSRWVWCRSSDWLGRGTERPVRVWRSALGIGLCAVRRCPLDVVDLVVRPRHERPDRRRRIRAVGDRPSLSDAGRRGSERPARLPRPERCDRACSDRGSAFGRRSTRPGRRKGPWPRGWTHLLRRHDGGCRMSGGRSPGAAAGSGVR